METIRVLHVVHKLTRGGMESRIMDVYRKLDHDRFQYDFYIESGKSGVFDAEVEALGGRLYYSQGKKISNIPNFGAFYQFLKKHPEYKIVNAYNQWSGMYLRKAKRCGVPVRIANARTSIEIKSIKNRIKNLVKQNVNRYATHRFAVSKKAAIWLFGEKMVQAARVRVWPNAIDTVKYAFSVAVRSEVRDELELGNAFTIIHVGNIRPEKNHPYLLRVFAEIKKKRPSAKLVLVGGGDIETLKPMMKDLDIEKDVKYLGVRHDVQRILQAGDVFVFPSFYEGFPGAVLEAESSGLPCIVSDSITNEVALTDCIQMLPLSIEPCLWAEAATQTIKTDRRNKWEVIQKAGYDIKDQVDRTVHFLEDLKYEH